MFFYSKIRLSKLRKSILEKLWNSLRLLLFSIILLIFLLKITFSSEKKGNFKLLKDKKNVKSDLNFRIINEKSEEIKRLNVNIN